MLKSEVGFAFRKSAISFKMIRSRRWAITALVFTTFLFVSLPFAPVVWLWVLPKLRPDVTRWFMVAGAMFLMALGFRVCSASLLRKGRRLMVLVFLAAAYVILLKTMYMRMAPAQKAHLIEYGMLSYITSNAVRVRSPMDAGLVIALGFTMLVGFVDECIQWILPMRYFSFKDVGGNWLGVIFGYTAWLSASPNSPWHREDQDRA
jgi:hypothetical protein